MPIKWSAVKVSEAMDGVESQIALAERFIAEAKAKVTEAKSIADLPQYIDERLYRLIDRLERIKDMTAAVQSVRDSIPAGAIEAEREKAKYGNQQSLI